MSLNELHAAQDDLGEFAMGYNFSCSRNCNQGRNCDCEVTSELIPEPDRHEDEGWENWKAPLFWGTLSASVVLTILVAILRILP